MPRKPLRLSVALGLALAAQAGLAQRGPVLKVPVYYQEHSNWCWAATVSAPDRDWMVTCATDLHSPAEIGSGRPPVRPRRMAGRAP